LKNNVIDTESPEIRKYLMSLPEGKRMLQDLAEIQKEEARRRCKKDLLYLGHEVLGYKDLTAGDFDESRNTTHPYRHIEVMLDRFDEFKKPFNLFLIPRDCLKTTLITITKTIQRIIRNGDVRILLTNAVRDNAIKMLSEIKGHLTDNQKFVRLFGNMKGQIWREDEITVSTRIRNSKELTVEVGSPGTTKTSRHYDFIVADDLVTRDNITSSEAKENLYKYFQDLLDLLDHPHGVIDVVGTRWDFGDLYSTLMDPENKHIPDFNFFVKGAYDTNGKLEFPWKLDERRLEMMKRNKSALEFSAQYLNDPVPSEDATFKEEMFKNTFDWTELSDKKVNKFLLCDPSSTKKGYSSYSTIMDIWVDENDDWYITDIIQDKFEPEQLERKFFKKMTSDKYTKQCIEVVGFMGYVKSGIENIMKSKRIYRTITPLKPATRTKEDRILALEPRYKLGKIKYPKQGIHYINQQGKKRDMVFATIQEFIKFPSSKTKDIMDVQAYGCDICYPPNKNKPEPILYDGNDALKRKEIRAREKEKREAQFMQFVGGDEIIDEMKMYEGDYCD